MFVDREKKRKYSMFIGYDAESTAKHRGYRRVMGKQGTGARRAERRRGSASRKQRG